ncbi:MAG: NAD(P)/FAD-dependent oxidoreductase [Bacillota bacterium]|nr:NAD(P)/FAD-dependent oxidoreductase [Bacillota bacterium]
MFDIVIIGKGPAGISAALYTCRAGLHTAIIAENGSSLVKAEKIENYFGFPGGISGSDLLERGEEQAKLLGAEIYNAQVVSFEKTDFIKITTDNGVFEANGLIIATGKPKKKAEISGLERFEGAGVSYCAICDGFFFRGKNVAVLGAGKFAEHEANDLANFSQYITILTNGEEITGNFSEMPVISSKITSLEGSDRLERIKFENDKVLDVDGLFIALGTASAVDFAKKAGIEVVDGSIKVDSSMKTNVEGIFACGDAVGGFLQVSTAVGEGALAGSAASKYVKTLKNRQG